jgi:hypothetical protein
MGMLRGRFVVLLFDLSGQIAAQLPLYAACDARATRRGAVLVYPSFLRPVLFRENKPTYVQFRTWAIILRRSGSKAGRNAL